MKHSVDHSTAGGQTLACALFSWTWLVDARRLDAECFSEVDKALNRGAFPTLPELACCTEHHAEGITAEEVEGFELL